MKDDNRERSDCLLERPEFSREQIFKVRNRTCKETIDAMGSWKDE